MSSMPNPLQGVSASNPLGWPGQLNTPQSGAPSVPGLPGMFGVPSSPVPTNPTIPKAAGTPGSQNPYGEGTRGGGDLTYNLAETNLQTGLLKNALAPLFTQALFGAAGPASQYFQTLMNLGSPYYQQQQRASFEQGVGEAQNTAAQSRQQLNAMGYGAAPSGLQAAMLGGQATGQANNLAQLFLQNLFQNEALQAQGAQGLAAIAQLFNPASLLTGTNPQIQQPTNTLAETMSGIGNLFNGLFGSGGASNVISSVIPSGG